MTQRSGMSATGEPVAGAAAHAVYVYGVVRVDQAAPESFPAGVAGGEAPVRLVEQDGLAVVVSDVPSGWSAATRADVEAHERVLGALVQERTVVPMRFGMVLDSDDAAREVLLNRHRGQIDELLTRLDGHVQMSVKAFYVEEGLLREVLRQHPELKRRSDALGDLPIQTSESERIALGRDVAHAVEQQRAHDQSLLAEPLAAAVREIRLEALRSDRLALNAQLLVAKNRQSDLDAAVERLTAEHRDRFAFRYVGPVAPYSFADLALDAQENSWD